MKAIQSGLSHWAAAIACTLLLVCSAGATSVPRISFNEMTDQSEVIATGRITRTWSDWDPTHQYIWTHYQMTVGSTYKGQGVETIEISEPGGVVGNMGMDVAGAVRYGVGDNVLVFLQRMPNGYLRTTGWGQGQYRIDERGALHASESLRAEDLQGRVNPGFSSLDGRTLVEVGGRVSARVRALQNGGVK
jgi:hypothetical protein